MTKTNIKVHLLKDDGRSISEQEIRIFGINNSDINDYLHLREKIQIVFPGLRDKDFTVSWRDSEGDNIVISSDEELQIALKETKYRLIREHYVTLHTADSAGNNRHFSREHGLVHFGVTCDSCLNNVQGFRYKCLQCDDFDLCMDCEYLGLHSEHCMIRISTPMQWKHSYSKKLAHCVKKVVRRAEFFSNKEEVRGGCPHKNRGRLERNDCGENPSWLDTLVTYMNDWANHPNEGACPAKEATPSKASAPNAEETTKQPQPLESHVELLKSLGENIAHLLDPLGIDVSVEVKGDKKTTGANNSSGGASAAASNERTENDDGNRATTVFPNEKSTPKFPEEGKKLVSFENDEDSRPEKQSPSKETPTTPTNTAPGERYTLDTEGWTLLNRIEGSPILIAKPSDSSNGFIPKQSAPSAPVEAATQPQKSMYPTLPKEEKMFYHTNPVIQQAVEAMLQMGFSNEDGWLTQLLIAKNGDISKALDALQPICNYHGEITSVNAAHGGRTHDARVFCSSRVCGHLQNRHREGGRNSWLLGDSAYPLLPYLLTPKLHEPPGTPGARYTENHIRTRVVVEKCFGVMKGRWRCLRKEKALHYQPEFAGNEGQIVFELYH